MKKILLLAVFLLSIFSCSKKEENNSGSDLGTVEVTAGGETYLFKVNDKEKQGINLLFTYGLYKLSAVDHKDLKKSFVLSGLSQVKMKGVMLDNATQDISTTVIMHEEDDMMMTMTISNGRASGTFSGKMISGKFTNVTYVTQ